MPTFICRASVGQTVELDAETWEDAAHNFAVGSFGDYPGEMCTVWVADKAQPEVAMCITVRIPDSRPFEAAEQTEQERAFLEWAREIIRDPQSLFDDPLPHHEADEAARRILADADFTSEIEPCIVPVEIAAEYSRTRKTEVFFWKLAGWREAGNEGGPAKV